MTAVRAVMTHVDNGALTEQASTKIMDFIIGEVSTKKSQFLHHLCATWICPLAATISPPVGCCCCCISWRYLLFFFLFLA